MVNFLFFLDEDVLHSTPYGAYIHVSQLIKFARVSSHVTDVIKFR